MAKKRKKKLHKTSSKKLPASSDVIIKKDDKNKLKIFGIALWKIIVSILLILGGIATYEPIKNLLLTPKERYEKENFSEGDLKPHKISNTSEKSDSGYSITETPPIFTSRPMDEKYPAITGLLLRNFSKKNYVWVTMGSTLIVVPKDFFSKGVQINIPMGGGKCGNSKIVFGVKDNRLYVSVEFKDLEKEQTIGIIEFNHWKLYKPNLFDFNNDDNRLEVRDKQNNIVFSIAYELTNEGFDLVKVCGYFINPTSVLVLPTHVLQKEDYFCFDKSDSNWKAKALTEIVNIKSIFP